MTNFDQYLQDTKKILLITSQPIDPDCISSGIILKKYLEHKGYDVTFRFPKELVIDEIERNKYLPYFNEFIAQDTREVLKDGDFDTLILLDGTNLVQFYDYKNTKLPEPVLDKTKKIIQIDHHLGDPEDLATHQIKNSKASSTIEILLSEVIPEDFIDENLATLAYIGLMGDTGNFQWNFNPTTLKLASMLLSKGANPTEALDRMFSRKSRPYMEMLGYSLQNTQYDDETQSAFLLLPLEKQQKDELDDKKYRLVKDSFIADISKNVDGYPRGFVISELKEKNKIKVGARGSNLRNKISLPELLQALGGNGGGHFHAAGMEANCNFEEFVEKIKQEIKKRL